jgi:DNA-binding transcriptional regulator YhcF (GntR family)
MNKPLNLNLDRRAKVPLAEQIRRGVTTAIEGGVLEPGARLPSWQDLAAQLGVARGTVRTAYEKLAAARLENSRRPNRQMRMAFEFKEEFDRSRKSPLSATINIDRSTFPQSTGDAAPPALPKTTVGSARDRPRCRLERSQLGFRPDYGRRRRQAAARQSLVMDRPARSGA